MVFLGLNDCRNPEFGVLSQTMDQYTTTTTDSSVRLNRLRSRLPAPMPDWMHRPLRVVPAVVVINVLVFLAWQAIRWAPGLENFMITNFLVSWVHLEHGLVWTLLTAAFSHSELWHIAINMVVLWSFGSVLERLLGWRVFLAFYLTSGIVASIAHCVVSWGMGRADVPALGASGAVSALLLVYALLFPKARLLVFGIIPVPALAGALFFVGLDLWGLVAQGQGGGLPIGHGAHLGGALCGFLFWWFALRGRFGPSAQRDSSGSSGRLQLTPEEAEQFDKVRQKLSIEGPEGLSREETEFLRSIRERVLKGSE